MIPRIAEITILPLQFWNRFMSSSDNKGTSNRFLTPFLCLSSFTVVGRDSLPAKPDRWLSTPLAMLSEGMGERLSGLSRLSSRTGLSGARASLFELNQIDKTDQIDQTDEHPLLSLRQIVPPGFLTQTFAGSSSAGCTS